MLEDIFERSNVLILNCVSLWYCSNMIDQRNSNYL